MTCADELLSLAADDSAAPNHLAVRAHAAFHCYVPSPTSSDRSTSIMNFMYAHSSGTARAYVSVFLSDDDK